MIKSVCLVCTVSPHYNQYAHSALLVPALGLGWGHCMPYWGNVRATFGPYIVGCLQAAYTQAKMWAYFVYNAGQLWALLGLGLHIRVPQGPSWAP